MEFLKFNATEPLKILKHCATRWLPLEKRAGQLLHHWEALTSYFQSNDDVEKPDRKVKRAADLFTNPEMRLYYLFLEFILAPLNEFKSTFQVLIYCSFYFVLWSFEDYFTYIVNQRCAKTKVTRKEPLDFHLQNALHMTQAGLKTTLKYIKPVK